MTMNKFMIFCKDFEIAQVITPTQSKYKNMNIRQSLMEIFKKNAECYKEMSFNQFV